MVQTLTTFVQSLLPSNRPSRPDQSPAHIATGRRGEYVAARYLRGRGYRILGSNVRIHKDEIDIIAFDPSDRVVVFAEVKTRALWHEDFRPDMNADWRKRLNMLRSARRWVADHGYDGGYRIDLICVAGDQVIQHVRELNSQ